MKKIFASLCLLLMIKSYTQNDSTIIDLEKKYDFVEVWGLKKQTKKEFLEKIIKCPGGIYESSLKLMGYNDGNKIPLPFSNKIIVTTRNITDYKTFPIYNKKIKTVNNESAWKELTKAINKLSNYEKQQLPTFLEAYDKNNQKVVDSLFLLSEQEFQSYGIQLKKEKINEAYKVYQNFAKLFTKDELLDLLYHSEDSAKNEAAQFITSHYLKTAGDLIDFLPLLLNKKIVIQPIISQFINSNDLKIDWNQNIKLLQTLLNNPNPFQALLALQLADKTGLNNKEMKQLLSGELITIKEILQSNVLKEEKTFVLSFLNKYSNSPIESNAEKWIQKLTF
jgi:hypothetical protein